MRAVTGQGCNKNGAPLRTDLPLHDMTGGNYWTPDAILYQNSRNLLRLGGGLSATQIDAIREGKSRAQQQLEWAASLAVSGNSLRVTNLTGHKLISGYPEGRRMWLNVKWYDGQNALLREDGAYGPLAVTIAGQTAQVDTILNPADPNTKLYEAHYAMTQDWAQRLLALGYDAALPLAFDRVSGAVTVTLGQLAARSAGSYEKTFHFVLNNHVAMDNRIPPYGMSYDEAKKRNTLPVPASQYGGPGKGGRYAHWDTLALNPPAGAAYATIDLLYQPTSWEYVQFLYLANNRQNAFLANEGANLLEAWLNTGMAEPHVMASTTWGSPPAPVVATPGAPQNLQAVGGKRSVSLSWAPGEPAPAGGYRIYLVQAGKLQFLAGVSASTLTYDDTRLSKGTTYTYAVTAWNDADGNGVFDAGVDKESEASNQASATAK
jgi:hypothetical protein